MENDGAYWSPFGVYPVRTILDKLGEIPQTAVKVRLPERLERIIGEIYILSHIDRKYIRRKTISTRIPTLSHQPVTFASVYGWV